MLKNQKIEITKYIAEKEILSHEDPHFNKLLNLYWQNTRLKEHGGLRLTEKGFEILGKYFKFHFVRFEETQEIGKYSNKLIIRLDNYIDCPWYINHKGIWVTSDKMAVQLVLFSGNIIKFTSAKARSLDKVTN